MTRREPRVQSIKRGKISFGRKYLPKSDFLETSEREREREEEEERILRRFLGFRQSEVVEPRVKVLRLNESYA